MTPPLPFNLLTILGPTASGKTRLAVALARELDGEIISADSRQIFRGMDIGTGKDLHEYGEVPCHLIDILESGAEFSVFAFQRLFREAFADITARGRLPILCGGTGLYLDAVLRGYRMVEVPENDVLRAELEGKSADELAVILRELKTQQHNTSDLLERGRTIRAIEIARFEREHATRQEPLQEVRSLTIGIRWERSELRKRITERLRLRLENGMIDSPSTTWRPPPWESVRSSWKKAKTATRPLGGPNFTTTPRPVSRTCGRSEGANGPPLGGWRKIPSTRSSLRIR